MNIVEKWGFGMAPIKPEVQSKRIKAAKLVKRITMVNVLDADEETLESISLIKGLFTRAYKQDQWDWFTVWTQLGRPSQKKSINIAKCLQDLRLGLINRNHDNIQNARENLQKNGVTLRLSNFINGHTENKVIGQIYILSTRENREILKIGYTDRNVEDRVKEINSSTGILVPYGVRAVWNVKTAKEVEAKIHSLLDQYRIRKDREFFNLDFKDAFTLIRDYIYEMRLEEEDN